MRQLNELEFTNDGSGLQASTASKNQGGFEPIFESETRSENRCGAFPELKFATIV